jgi:hypothetical protein
LEFYVGKILRSVELEIQAGAVLGSVLDGINETNLRWGVGTTTCGEDGQDRKGQRKGQGFQQARHP